MGDRPDSSGARRAAPGPPAGAHGLLDVQRRGLTAAGELVDRLIRAVDGDGDGNSGGGSGTGGNGDRSGGDGYARDRQTGGEGAAAPGGSAPDLLELWLDVVRLGLDAFGQFLTPALAASAGGDAGATVDVTTGASAGAVRLEVTRSSRSSGAGGGGGGERAGAEVWLHNGSDNDHTGLVVHAGDLRASDGAVLAAEALRLAPAIVDLPARSSRGIVISVDADVAQGTYRGVLLVTGVPDAWLPIEVSVTLAPGEG